MTLADPTDWCTIAYAAERIGVSQRQVRRFIAAGSLTGYRPRVGKAESGRRHILLGAAAVDVFATAHKLATAHRADG